MNENSVLELCKSTEDLANELKLIAETYEKSVQQLNQKFKQIEQCISKCMNNMKANNELLSEWKEVKKQLNYVSGSERTKYESAVNEMKKKLDENVRITETVVYERHNHSNFLRSLIGDAPLKLWNETDQMKFKREYNNFKERTLIFFIMFPLCQIYLEFSILLHQIHMLFLFYYYVSLALRENILKQNGSRIEPWWMYHHYITLFVSLLRTTLRPKSVKEKNKMDVRTSEVIDEKPHGDFLFLIPTLYATYLFQLLIAFYFAYIFFGQPFSCLYERAQMGLLAIVWAILPFGNLSTLIKVLNGNPTTSSLAHSNTSLSCVTSGSR
ncbi:hypothetical protein RFI_30670 [Reticulomyxa filosa]|uniref:Transmembrane protein n=1 Tax=Reticulomyxa filosa TaxID=46433 RepID=X6LZY7_RETFI|nr:hypothetical protein RFI_30670 [Reticulomyxa filosa]|eukprot:ETO06722.1 hypothetical protein RFI_30670 [Reticulomyxa filosa]